MLNNKKILFIAPETYDYHRILLSAISGLGASVDFSGENTLSLCYRIATNFSSKYLDLYKKQFITSILERSYRTRYDYIFLIRGDLLDADFMRSLRECQPDAKFIMYQWDSMARYNYIHLVPYFDRVYSFDRADCEKYGFSYYPLFFDNLSVEARGNGEPASYGLVFIGGLHGDRYKVINNICAQLDDFGVASFIYIYTPFLTFAKGVCRDRKVLEFNNVRFRTLSRVSTFEIIKRANAVLDINSEQQTGLTIRTMEALGAGKKLITTNDHIKRESFYDSQVIRVIDRNNPVIDKKFIEELVDHCVNDIDLFKVDNWILKILG